MKTTIVLQKEFSAEDLMTREGGEKLRHLILSQQKFPILIDLKSKPIASVSFWDEGIAKLILEGWSKQKIASDIEFKDLHPRDQEIINKLTQERAKNL